MMRNMNVNNKYLVQAYSSKNDYKEQRKECLTKLEAKSYIDDLAKKNEHNEVSFFLYSITDLNNKELIGHMKYNYGVWEDFEFYKRGSEINNPTDIFSWENEYPENDQEDEEII